MSRRASIGGALDYRRLAELHKPADAAAIAAEIRRLHGDGLKPRDISIALRISLETVLAALQSISTNEVRHA
jgi:hypothetical protein